MNVTSADIFKEIINRGWYTHGSFMCNCLKEDRYNIWRNPELEAMRGRALADIHTFIGELKPKYSNSMLARDVPLINVLNDLAYDADYQSGSPVFRTYPTDPDVWVEWLRTDDMWNHIKSVALDIYSDWDNRHAIVEKMKSDFANNKV